MKEIHFVDSSCTSAVSTIESIIGVPMAFRLYGPRTVTCRIGCLLQHKQNLGLGDVTLNKQYTCTVATRLPLCVAVMPFSPSWVTVVIDWRIETGEKWFVIRSRLTDGSCHLLSLVRRACEACRHRRPMLGNVPLFECPLSPCGFLGCKLEANILRHLNCAVPSLSFPCVLGRLPSNWMQSVHEAHPLCPESDVKLTILFILLNVAGYRNTGPHNILGPQPRPRL
jgi:hypothetical protein